MSGNKFGMFIHWGIYALTGIQEQALARFAMPRENYESLRNVFNPTGYDPEKWVLLAKQAGMKYICFTAKHHDGFCMWNTRCTDYNIMNTPYGRDVLKLLADACRKHDMRLSIYYSNPDWHSPVGFNPNSTHQWRAVNAGNPDMAAYIEYVKNQMTELLTNYGDIYTLFWDIPPKISDPSVNALARRLQPGILINDRGFDAGDFSTPEREYKTLTGNRFTSMTEACNSVGEQSWGFRECEDFHTIRYLTCSIDRVMAMGGSYLLNVGPDADGIITERYAERIRRVGDWYNRMEECLEDTEGDCFDYGIKHNAYIANKKNGRSYFHFYNGISSSAVNMKYYPSAPVRVRLMNTGEDLRFTIEPLPDYFSSVTGVSQDYYLHISGIPADALSSEPVVLEVEWSHE